MDVYTQLFGINSQVDEILNLLNFNREIARFRDAFIGEDDLIGIYCRIGGANRDVYNTVNTALAQAIEFDPETMFGKDLRNDPYYVEGSEIDDDFDNSYCTFYFAIPHDKEDEAALITRTESPNERWNDFIIEYQMGSVEVDDNIRIQIDAILEGV